MKALIAHHLARALAGIEYNALRHCHVKNLYSIVLHDEPGNRLRMFFAGPMHELWHNVPDCVGNSDTLAVHPHHCDVRLVKLFGDVTNYRMGIVPRSEGAWHEFKYVSAITTNGPGSLTATGRRAELLVAKKETLDTTGLYMKAWELHTIYVQGGCRAAWLVIEGAEDPDYEPLCWSRSETHDLTGLYEKMTAQEAANILQITFNEMR